jgi:hypothetical protein
VIAAESFVFADHVPDTFRRLMKGCGARGVAQLESIDRQPIAPALKIHGLPEIRVVFDVNLIELRRRENVRCVEDLLPSKFSRR